MERVFNFSAGPATLPLPVLHSAQAEFLNIRNSGMSVLEISHRSQIFEQILRETQENLRALLKLPENYHILFLQGGASLQFALLAMNFAQSQPVGYLHSGTWAGKALAEAEKVTSAEALWSGKSTGFVRMPSQAEIHAALENKNLAYVHMTSNETIQGVAFQNDPDTGSTPLICDASSDILSRPLEIEKYDMIYAGAQKNMGPAGVTLVILKDSLAQRCSDRLPSMLNYGTYIEKNSLYNTPPVFSIYMLGKVTQWLRDQGGLDAIYRNNRQQAQALYECIDQSQGFYRGHAQADSRSLMNVTFRLESPELEQRFLAEAEARQLMGLKGHRSVGGIRASIYNAFPDSGIEALTDFMQHFASA